MSNSIFIQSVQTYLRGEKSLRAQLDELRRQSNRARYAELLARLRGHVESCLIVWPGNSTSLPLLYRGVLLNLSLSDTIYHMCRITADPANAAAGKDLDPPSSSGWWIDIADFELAVLPPVPGRRDLEPFGRRDLEPLEMEDLSMVSDAVLAPGSEPNEEISCRFGGFTLVPDSLDTTFLNYIDAMVQAVLTHPRFDPQAAWLAWERSLAEFRLEIEKSQQHERIL